VGHTVLEIDPSDPVPALKEAARVIRGGGLVAYPTESFYAIGADGLDPDAVGRVFRAKGRKEDNPVPVIVHDKRSLLALTGSVSAEARSAVEILTPGPVTLVLDAAPNVPKAVTGGTGKVGVRIPDDAIMLQLAGLSGVPVTATSANLSGGPGLTDPGEVIRALGGSIDLMLDGGPSPGPPPSTVLDVSVWPPVIIREGRLKSNEISALLQVTLSI